MPYRRLVWENEGLVQLTQTNYPLTASRPLPTVNRFIIPLAFFCAALRAQTPAELISQAGQAAGSGRYLDAANLYEKAARLRDNRPEWLYQAAEHYYRARDYRRATTCYQASLNELSKSELSGLRYARALKQEGRHAEAVEAFRQYAANYTGDRKASVLAVVANELNGCDLALRLMAEADSVPIPADATALLPAGINTPVRESAPLLWRDDVLYFNRLTDYGPSLWRTTRRFGAWQAPVEARGFPATVAPRLGSGTFTPDGSRFYCTLCDEAPPAERQTPGLRLQCELFLLRKTEQGWQEPERLRDYINLPDQTVLHPFVLHEADREVLFFASNREGGFGGLDLYVCQRPLDSDSLDFSLPQNLGPRINSAGDDITPFFDPSEQTLWFATNGHPGIGGLDIYRSQRLEAKWLPATHAGLPINSPYDDYFLVKKKNGDAVLVSNRPFGTAKISTADDDLFEFFPKKLLTLGDDGKPRPTPISKPFAVGEGADLPAPAPTQTSSFRVCLEVVPDFEPNAPRYRALRALGTLSSVPMPEQGMQRVLLGPFPDRQQANSASAKLRLEGFPQAFVVRQ